MVVLATGCVGRLVFDLFNLLLVLVNSIWLMLVLAFFTLLVGILMVLAFLNSTFMFHQKFTPISIRKLFLPKISVKKKLMSKVMTIMDLSILAHLPLKIFGPPVLLKLL